MALFLFSACDNVVEPEKYVPKRTILFYTASDSNRLDNGSTGDEPKQKIDAIRAGWTPGVGEMLIYTDQTGRGGCLLRVNGARGADGLYGLDTVKRYGPENSADSAVLRRVIEEVVSEYPADSYGMLFFSHASGWMPEGMLNSPRSLVIDKGGGAAHEMEYHEFAAAIPDGRFDFIIFEACLMADVMSMYELRNKAAYILASSAEIVSPGFTYIYMNKIMGLYETGRSTAAALAAFGQSYYDAIVLNYSETSEYCSVTLSLIDMKEMASLASATKVALQGATMDERALKADSVQHFDRPYSGTFGWQRAARYFDLAHAVEQIASEAHYATFGEQMNKTVVWKAATKNFLYGNDGGFAIKRHSGLTTYISQDVYPALNSTFRNSSWYKAIDGD